MVPSDGVIPAAGKEAASTSQPRIRPGQDSDADAFIALIWACWSRHPGIRMDVDGEMPELRALASYYTGQGGALWAADSDGRTVGMIATRPLRDGVWEICRVYVDPARHGGGLGHQLLDVAETHALAAGATRLVLWSDTRFDRAHRFYEKRSYVRQGPIRVLRDISNSLEYGYANPVNGIELLDAAASASAVPALARLIVACTDSGEGTPFLPPLPRAAAQAYWQAAARDVAMGVAVVLGAWSGGTLTGTAILTPASAQTQSHRAEITALLAEPALAPCQARRLMQQVEQEAARRGYSLLTIVVVECTRAYAICRDMGWQEAGRIPSFALRKDGAFSAGVLLWKQVASPWRSC